jgi:hypothetical protein
MIFDIRSRQTSQLRQVVKALLAGALLFFPSV